MAAVIGQHPQLYGLPEIHLLGAQTVAEFLQQCDEATFPMADGLVRAVAQLYFARQTDNTVARACGWLARRAHFSTGLLFETLGRRVFPLGLVEKSPSLVYDIDRLRRVRAMFPDARFIHLLRHPIGQGGSVLRYINERQRHGPMASTHWLWHLAAFPHRFPDETDEPDGQPDPQRGWYALNANIRAFAEELPDGAVLRIRGEDVLGDPDRALPAIAAWLGLRSDAPAVDEMKRPERSPYARYGPRTAQYGNDRLFLDSPALRPERDRTPRLTDPLPWAAGRTLHPDVVRLAQEFGYE